MESNDTPGLGKTALKEFKRAYFEFVRNNRRDLCMIPQGGPEPEVYFGARELEVLKVRGLRFKQVLYPEGRLSLRCTKKWRKDAERLFKENPPDGVYPWPCRSEIHYYIPVDAVNLAVPFAEQEAQVAATLDKIPSLLRLAHAIAKTGTLKGAHR